MKMLTVKKLGVKKDSGRKKNYKLGHNFKTQLELRIMLWPSIFLIFIFIFIPLFGLIMAFKDYDPISGIKGIFTSRWNNFENFTLIFRNFEFWPMVRNTVGINVLGSIVSIPVTLTFALLLNEITNQKFKSLVQTVTYMPHFISWVVYGGLFINILSTDGGIVNTILVKLGLVERPVNFLGEPSYFWWVVIVTGLMKDLGWGTILYLAAMAGVDVTLYEAATIDGAGRFKKMIHITLPSIKPTVMILIIFAISGMLNNNFTQIYVFQNSLNLPASQVIDTYVYQIGLRSFQFDTATAIGLMKSVFALVLLLGANYISKKLTDSGLF
jgi:putative aldouronate transport system permease protein